MLESGLKKLEELLSTTKRDGTWAHDINYLTMDIVEGMIEQCPSPDYVNERVRPLLVTAHELVQQVSHEGDYGLYINHFSERIGSRIAEVDEYISSPLITRL